MTRAAERTAAADSRRPQQRGVCADRKRAASLWRKGIRVAAGRGRRSARRPRQRIAADRPPKIVPRSAAIRPPRRERRAPPARLRHPERAGWKSAGESGWGPSRNGSGTRRRPENRRCRGSRAVRERRLARCVGRRIGSGRQDAPPPGRTGPAACCTSTVPPTLAGPRASRPPASRAFSEIGSLNTCACYCPLRTSLSYHR